MNSTNIYKTISAILILLIIPQISNAQITMGSNTAPLSFVTLQIDGVDGGMRFPHITTATDKTNLTNTLTAAGDIAGGIIIFDTQSGKNILEYWDAKQKVWIAMDQSLADGGLAGHNGISGSNTLDLGGQLSQQTTIDLKGKELLFKTTTSQGKLTFSQNVLVAKDNKIGIGTDNPSVAKVNIEVADKSNTEKRFRYEDPSAGIGKVLTSDINGNAKWTDLKHRVEIVEGTMLAKSLGSNAEGTPKFVSNSIGLTRGKWLVIARVTTINSTSNQYVWFRLRGYAQATFPGESSSLPAGVKEYQWLGARAEGTSGAAYSKKATPQIFHIIDVKDSDMTNPNDPNAKYYIRLYMSTSTGNISTTLNTDGKAYFYAIKLS